MTSERDYPNDEELHRIETWPYNDIDGALQFVKTLWHWPDFVQEYDGVLYLATGGWSGNEEIISAMRKNLGIQSRWICSTTGGAHEYELHAREGPDAHRQSRFALSQQYAALALKYKELVQFYDAHVGTPCEQIRHQQEVAQLQETIAALTAKLAAITNVIQKFQL